MESKYPAMTRDVFSQISLLRTLPNECFQGWGIYHLSGQPGFGYCAFGFFRVSKVFTLIFNVEIVKNPGKLLLQNVDTENSNYSIFLLHFVYSGVKSECFALPQIFLVPHLPQWSQVHVFNLANLSLQLMSSHSQSALFLLLPHVGLSNSIAFCSAVLTAVVKFDNSLLHFASLETIYRKIHAILTRCQKLCQSIGQVKIQYLIAEVCLYLCVVEIFIFLRLLYSVHKGEWSFSGSVKMMFLAEDQYRKNLKFIFQAGGCQSCSVTIDLQSELKIGQHVIFVEIFFIILFLANGRTVLVNFHLFIFLKLA